MEIKEMAKRYAMPVAAIIGSIGIGFAGVSSAESATTTTGAALPAQERGMGERPGAFGKVTAISGTTITIEEQQPGAASATDYTIDASNATVKKAAEGSAPADSSVSAIAVGDTIMARGTLSGATVMATEIVDGLGGMRGGPGGGRGTVSAVSGNTITLTGADGKTYTVDASSAKLDKISTIAVGDVQVGDTLDVMGTVSGTNVTAKDIRDGVSQGQGQ